MAVRVDVVSAGDMGTQFLGHHDHDLVRWIAGAEVRRVMAASRSRVLRPERYEDTSIALLDLAHGALACSRLREAGAAIGKGGG